MSDLAYGYGFNNIGTSESSTCAGNAVKHVLSPSIPAEKRSGVFIKNHDGSLNIWIKLVEASASAPTIDSTHNDFVIGPGVTAVLAAGASVGIYAKNSAGDGTTVAYTATPYLY